MENNIKVLLVTPSLTGGGAEKMLLFVANTLNEYGFSVTVGSFSKEEIENYQFNVVTLNSNANGKLIDKIKKSIILRKIIKNGKFDIVLTFGITYALICKMSSLFLPVKLIASERRAPMQLNLHWKLLTHIIYRMYDGIVFQLSEVEEYFGFNKNIMVKVIPNPYISETNNSNIQETRKKYIISAAARLDEYEKGMDVLLDSFELLHKIYPEYELHLYGDIMSDNNISKKLSKTNSYVKVYPKTSNVISKINEADIFVLPSRMEGIPNILLEAMGEGNATISSNCSPGGPKLLTNNGVDGLLFENENIVDLYNKLKYLIDNPTEKLALAQSSTNVRKRFEDKKIKKLWIKCILEVFER